MNHLSSSDCDILTACLDFVNSMMGKDRGDISNDLAVAEKLAQQILLHYEGLAQVSVAFIPFCKKGEKIPPALLTTLLFAAVREHAFLGHVLDEIYELYGCEKYHPQAEIVRNFMRHGMRLFVIPPLQMIDNAGVLRYQPAAFALIHRGKFAGQINDLFKNGASGIEIILGHYPNMNAASKKLLDEELTRRVYLSMIEDGSPIRNLLKDKLDDVEDARQRISSLLYKDLTNDPNEVFLKSLDFAFDFLDTLPEQKARDALGVMSTIMSERIEQNHPYGNDMESIRCLVKAMVRAREHGFDPMAIIARHVSFKDGERGLLPSLLDNFSKTKRINGQIDGADLWMQAGVLSLGVDKLLLSDHLDESHLVWLFRHIPSFKIREMLLKTHIGRDEVFGQDLGL